MPVLTVELHRGGQRSASLPLGERREGTRPAPRSASCDGSDYGQQSKNVTGSRKSKARRKLWYVMKTAK